MNDEDDLHGRVAALEITVEGMGEVLKRVDLRTEQTHAIVKHTAVRVARLDDERGVNADEIQRVREEAEEEVQRVRVELAELRGRVIGADDTGRHAALVVEAAVRAREPSRPDPREMRDPREGANDNASSEIPPPGRTMRSWRPQSRKGWVKLVAAGIGAVTLLAGAVRGLSDTIADILKHLP